MNELEDFDKKFDESMKAMQEFIEWSQWHYDTFARPLLEALAETDNENSRANSSAKESHN